jgi:hypothetical protein
MRLFEQENFRKELDKVKSILDSLSEKYAINFTAQISDKDSKSQDGILYANRGINLEEYHEHLSYYSKEYQIKNLTVNMYLSGSILVRTNKNLQSKVLKRNTIYVVEEISIVNKRKYYKLQNVEGIIFPSFGFNMELPRVKFIMN